MLDGMQIGVLGGRSTMPARRAGVHAAVGAVVLAVLAVGLAPSEAGAAVERRLEDARTELRALTERIVTQAAEADGIRVRVAAADARVRDATRRLGLLLEARFTVEDDLARSEARYDLAREELTTIAVEAFMGAPGGSPDVMTLGAALGATSFADLGDSVAYASAIGDARAEVAARVEEARRRLDARASTLDGILAEHSAVLEQLEAARSELASSLAAHEAAAAALDATRDEIVTLVGTLTDRAAAAALGGVGAAFAGPHHVSYGAWAVRFLEYMGLPTCRANLILVVAWQVQEFTQAAWNPLATTHRMRGSTDFNWVGVQNFVSLRQGLEATRQTVENGLEIYRYGAIVDALAACEDPLVTAEAIAASSWCPGCLQGLYVVGLVPKVVADYHTYASI